jgi:hypothetical protein
MLVTNSAAMNEVDKHTMFLPVFYIPQHHIQNRVFLKSKALLKAVISSLGLNPWLCCAARWQA